jgi:hypothetical protein
LLACHGFDPSQTGKNVVVPWRSVVLALLYSALAALTALALLVYGAYDCYESCRYDVANPPWTDDSSAWQWDVIFWSGVASGIASIAFLVAVFRLGARPAGFALAAHVSLAAFGAGFVRAADQVNTSDVVLVLAGLFVFGSALIAVRASPASSRAGARGTRADPTA